MKLATLIYKQHLRSKGIKRKLWYLLRKLVVGFFNDPLCLLTIHGKELVVPLSHELPVYLDCFPNYDQLPRRIGKYIHKKQGYLCCIDVGANVGDTIASFYRDEEDTFLAIEPNQKFNELLLRNWGWNKNIKIVSNICSSSNSKGMFKFKERNGTASIHETKNGLKMSLETLDKIFKAHPFVANANVLKIDTDGHDFEVLLGAQRLLSKNRPALLFECDIFENINYVDDCLKTLALLESCGYQNFLLYDNFGNLMGKHSLSNLLAFRHLLFFQIIGNFNYFDILVMKDPDLSQFYDSEIAYYVDQLPNKLLKRTALAAVE